MTKFLRLILIVIFLFQIAVASGFELAHDEAYYWLFSRHLDWGYFDHPPFVAAIIKMFSFFPTSEISVRIGFIVLQFLSLFILIRMTTKHLLTTLLFFSFPLASFTGLLALPDIPLLFMTACYCFLLYQYLLKDSVIISLSLGLVIALLFFAKYHGVLLVFFTLLAVPGLFKKKSFYLVALTALVLFMPHMVWQYEHDFSTLRYHFIERPSADFSIARSLEYFGLQIGLAGLFVGPVVWWVIIKNKSENEFQRAMKFISIGTVIFFLISSFSKRVEANWTIFLVIPMILLVAKDHFWEKRFAKYLLGVSFAVIMVARILFVLPPEMVKIKRLKEFHGWSDWALKVRSECGESPILANSYQIASKLSFYLQQEISALNYHSRKNQFDYWKWDRKIPTDQVCYVTDKRAFPGEIIFTPEGKELRLVKNQDLKALWALKYSETSR